MKLTTSQGRMKVILFVTSTKVTPEIVNFMSKEGRGLICCFLLNLRGVKNWI